ncbi:MAG: DUF5698 domain-containing protein [Phycisphaerales bacterium]
MSLEFAFASIAQAAAPADASPSVHLMSLISGALLIVVARIADVSLGTLRTVAVINGRRTAAWALGFLEVLIWVLVVSQVIASVRDNWIYALAYAFGFATGNFIGITIEQYFAFGRQIVRIFTREGVTMAAKLREAGLGVTEFDGRGRDGPVAMLFVDVERRAVRTVTDIARSVDPTCFYTIADVREASTARGQRSRATHDR